MKSVITLAASLGLGLSSGCAVAPAVVPTCTTVVAPSAASAAAFASVPPPAPAPLAQRPVYVRPVIPPLPAELAPPSATRAGSPKAVAYAADLLAAMVATVPDTDVFLAGGDTYFWHRDPRGHRERVFYGHGDRRAEIAQRRAAAPSHLADAAKARN